MEKSEEHNAMCGNATGAGSTASRSSEDVALTSTVAAMATAMACLVEPSDAAALNEAAAKLMKGASDGNA